MQHLPPTHTQTSFLQTSFLRYSGCRVWSATCMATRHFPVPLPSATPCSSFPFSSTSHYRHPSRTAQRHYFPGSFLHTPAGNELRTSGVLHLSLPPQWCMIASHPGRFAPQLIPQGSCEQLYINDPSPKYMNFQLINQVFIVKTLLPCQTYKTL